MKKQITLSILSILLLATAVSAAGVSSPYWTGETNSRPLVTYPGQIVDVKMTLQNMIGSEDLTFKASVTDGTSIAKITDASDIYEVPLGRDNIPVNVRVTIPTNAPIGSKYNVVVSFNSVSLSNSGAFTFGSAFDKEFEVVIQERPAPTLSPEEETTASNSTFIIVISLILLIILVIGILTLQRKKRK